MIEEVVNSILEAEDVAKKRIAEAEQRAAEIVSAAEIESEQNKKQASLQNKAVFAPQMKESEAAAERKAAARLAELNAETDKEIAAYAKNTDKAVKLILEQIK